MTESDDGWATVETVVDDGVDNNIDGVSGQGPSGIDENGVLEKSRWHVKLYTFEQFLNNSLIFLTFLQFFSSSVVSIHGFFSLLRLVCTIWYRSFGFPLRAQVQQHLKL